MTAILPGVIVIAYDLRTDKHYPAKVLRRYGFKSELMEKEFGEQASRYPDVCDLEFIHNGQLSTRHFTRGLVVVNSLHER